MIKPILGFLGLLVFSASILASEIGRGDWTHQQDADKINIG